MGSFDDFMSLGKPATAAWSSVEASLVAEGAPDVEIQRAKLLLGDQAMGLLRMVNNDTEQAIKSAHDFVIAGDTLAGTVTNVESLVSAVSTGNPAQVVQVTAGLLIGVATAAGIVSAGVGAAVVGVVASLSAILSQNGQYQYHVATAPGWGYQHQPKYLVGFMPGPLESPSVAPLLQSRSGPVSNQSWLPMPRRGGSWQWDGTRFSWKPGSDDPMFWQTPKWYFERYTEVNPPNDVKNSSDRTIADLYFPGYSAIIERNPLPSEAPVEVQKFLEAYRSAWKANKEAIYNGHTGSEDYEVLAHTVRIWNRKSDNKGPFYVLDAAKIPSLPIADASRQAKNLQPIDVQGDGQLIVYTRQRSLSARVISVHVRGLSALSASNAHRTAVTIPLKLGGSRAWANLAAGKHPDAPLVSPVMAGAAGAAAGGLFLGFPGAVLGMMAGVLLSDTKK